MKKKIMLVATGLSTSLILVSAIPGNVNQFWNAVGIEKIQADDSDDIETLIPDSALRAAMYRDIYRKYDELTMDNIGEVTNVGLQGKMNLEGLTYAPNITYISMSGPFDNLSILKDMPNLESVRIGNIHISNFDIFENIPLPKDDGSRPDNQTIGEPEIIVTDNKFEIDLDSYVGKEYVVPIGNVSVMIGNIKMDSSYDPDTRKVTLTDITEKLNTDDNTTDQINEDLTVKFDETVRFSNRDSKVTVTITQPFVIYMPVVRVKDVTMYVGDIWNNDMGLVKAQNNLGKTFKANELDVEGDVDTTKIGDTEITYRLKEDHSVFDTAKVKVVKRPTGGGGGNNSKIEDIKPTNIMTDKKLLDVYNVSGKKLEPKTLTKQTTVFVTEKINTIGKVQYYRIGENEWVKTDDVKVFHYNNAVKQTHGDDHKELTQFRNIGQVSNRALKPITNWVTDRYAYFKDEKYHRVATHEWVHDDHVVKYTSISGVVKVNEDVPLYNSQGKASNRGLMNNSEFITDKSAMINDQLMYRVATDEWVSAESVTLK